MDSDFRGIFVIIVLFDSFESITIFDWIDFEVQNSKNFFQIIIQFFVDAFKFLYDRSDYKNGWEIEREAEEIRFGKQEANYEIRDEVQKDLPFKCLICRNTLKDPVVTK